MTIRIFSIAITLAASLAATTAQADYDFHIFGYPGATFTQVFGNNDQGQVVGNGTLGGSVFPFVYDSKKQVFTDVPSVPGYDSTGVIGISDSGLLAGSVVSAGGSVTEALLIDSSGAATVFAHPESVSFTQARGVNNRGQVTGFRDSADDRFFPENGFIYDSRTGEFTDIVPSLFTLPQGINNKGEVVGSATFFGNESPCPADPSSVVRLGWVRAADGTVSYFKVNDSFTSARGISDSGVISGFVSTSTGARFFVLDNGVENCEEFLIPDEELFAPPGANSASAGSVNNAGQISGQTTTEDGVFGFVASPVPPKGKKK